MEKGAKLLLLMTRQLILNFRIILNQFFIISHINDSFDNRIDHHFHHSEVLHVLKLSSLQAQLD